MDVPSRAETDALEERRRRAMLAADLDELDTLLSDDLVYVHSSAAVDGKVSYLEKLRDRMIVYRDLAHRVDSLLVRPADSPWSSAVCPVRSSSTGRPRSCTTASWRSWPPGTTAPRCWCRASPA